MGRRGIIVVAPPGAVNRHVLQHVPETPPLIAPPPPSNDGNSNEEPDNEEEVNPLVCQFSPEDIDDAIDAIEDQSVEEPDEEEEPGNELSDDMNEDVNPLPERLSVDDQSDQDEERLSEGNPWSTEDFYHAYPPLSPSEQREEATNTSPRESQQQPSHEEPRPFNHRPWVDWAAGKDYNVTFGQRPNMRLEDLVSMDDLRENADDEQEALEMKYLMRHACDNGGQLPLPEDNPFLDREMRGMMASLNMPRSGMNADYQRKRRRMGRDDDPAYD